MTVQTRWQMVYSSYCCQSHLSSMQISHIFDLLRSLQWVYFNNPSQWLLEIFRINVKLLVLANRTFYYLALSFFSDSCFYSALLYCIWTVLIPFTLTISYCLQISVNISFWKKKNPFFSSFPHTTLEFYGTWAFSALFCMMVDSHSPLPLTPWRAGPCIIWLCIVNDNKLLAHKPGN